MQAIKIHARTDSRGTVTVNVNTLIPDSEMDLIIMIENASEMKKGTETSKYDLSEFVGKIQWDVDPVEYQRKLRDEW
jgi:hypothetical protein